VFSTLKLGLRPHLVAPEKKLSTEGVRIRLGRLGRQMDEGKVKDFPII